MFKTIFIIFLVLATAAIGGGSYYYFAIYQPANYAVFLLSLYQKLEAASLQPDTSLLKSSADYGNALEVFSDRIALLNSIKKDLGTVEIPKRTRNFHKEFADYIGFTLAQHEHGLKITSFLAKAEELNTLIAGIYKADLTKEKISTIGDLQKFWGERIPKTANAAEIMFSEEIEDFADPSFDELKLLWEGGSPAFDIVLNRVNAANPRLLISQAGNIFTKSEQGKLEESTKKVDEFTKKLDVLLQKYSAYDLLAFRYFPASSSLESSERALRFYQTTRILKERYVK